MAHEFKAPFDVTWTRFCPTIMKFGHEWTIENFSSVSMATDCGQCIQTSKFSLEDSDQVKFSLRAYLNGGNHGLYFKVFLGCDWELRFSTVSLWYKIYLVDINNTKKHSIEQSYTFSEKNLCPPPLIIVNSLLWQKKNVLLPNDKLTIGCEIILLDDIFTNSKECELTQDELLKPQMKDDFKKLFETLSLSDVTLTIGGKDIKAHKAVLAARSPIFLAMFQNDMEELKKNHVKINDIDYEVFMEALCFVYTDKAPNLQIMAMDLLTVADKYALEKLKLMCAKTLSKSLMVENAVDILVLSYLHNADLLKDAAINFICEQTDDIIETAGFKSMAHSYPGLVIDILRAMSTKMQRIKV